RVALVELRFRLDVLHVRRLERPRRVDQGEPVEAARLIRALGHAQGLLRLWDVGVGEEVPLEERGPDPQLRLGDLAADPGLRAAELRLRGGAPRACPAEGR